MGEQLPIIDSVLIGLGSVGKLHYRELQKRYRSILVVDTNRAVTEFISTFPNPENTHFSETLSDVQLPNVPKIAVVANWGPDHFESFEALASLGISNFLIEKPLSDSFEELSAMRKQVMREKLQIRVNLQRSFSYLPNLLIELDRKFGIGEPIGISVSGGAKCIATNGIHFLALANTLFRERPTSTVSSLSSQPINPRNPRFLFLEGVASWKYSHQRFLTVNFFNRSQISAKCEIFFARATAIIIGDEMILNRIPQNAQLSLTSATKTEYASETIYSGNAFIFPDGSSGMDKIYESFSGDQGSFLNDFGFGVAEDFLGSLLADLNCRSYDLPINLDPTDSDFSRKWMIS